MQSTPSGTVPEEKEEDVGDRLRTKGETGKKPRQRQGNLESRVGLMDSDISKSLRRKKKEGPKGAGDGI